MSLNYSNNNSSLMNQQSVYCQFRKTIYQNLESNAKTTLGVAFTVVGIIGVLINILVVIVVHRTKQLNVQSIQLFRNLSIFDIFTSLTNFVHLITILGTPDDQTKCGIHYALAFLLHWAIYSSSFMVFITGLDRYIHIKYLKEYNAIFTQNRFKVILITYFICVLYQSSATTVSLISLGPRTAGKYTLPMNAVVLFGIIFFYSRSIIMLKRHLKATQEISSMKKNIARIASLYLYFYLINIGILIMYQVIGNWTKLLERFDESSKSVIGIIYFIFPGITATVNAFGFLWINRKAKRWIKSFLPSNRRIHIRDVVVDDSNRNDTKPSDTNSSKHSEPNNSTS